MGGQEGHGVLGQTDKKKKLREQGRKEQECVLVERTLWILPPVCGIGGGTR